MPRHYQRNPDERSLASAEQATRENIRVLVARYESLRTARGRQRDHAYYALGLALRRYGYPFQWDGIVWAWSEQEDSITRARAAGMHTTHPDHKSEAVADSVPQSSWRQVGRGKAYGGWSIKGRSI